MSDVWDEVLLALGRELGIDGLCTDEQGCCRLVFDGQRVLELRPAPQQQRLLLSCRLLTSGPTTLDQSELLLRANAWCAGAGGGWFALDETQRLCLQHAFVPVDDSASALLQRIEGLLDAVERWELRLDASVASSTSVAAMAPWMQKV